MQYSSIWSALISFVIAFLITWIVLSVTLLWLQPSFYNDDGSLNWGTTAWVALVIVLLTFVFMFLFYVIFYFIKNYINSCEDPCEEIKIERCEPVMKMEKPCFPTKRMYNL